jgi:hypothetical protein
VSPNAVEPGTRLVDRYRLEEHLGAADGTTYWRAQDELLDRPVGVCLLPATEEQADQAERVLRAARRAAVLTDARFLRVLDASRVDGVVYVVSEWVAATNLVELLADGPLPPAEARDLAVDIAGALDAAHQAGLAHLCLQPEHVLRTSHGQVKVGGLAIDAAVRGIEPAGAEDASRRDAEGTARVAYAALTARWPGDPGTGLAAAPHDGPALCTPRQVRAGVPHDLDVVVSRALRIPGAPGGPLGSLAALTEALNGVHLPSRVGGGARSDSGPDRASTLTPYDEEPGPRRRSRAAVLAWAAAALVLAVGFALAGSQLWLGLRDGGGQAADASDTSPTAKPSDTNRATGKPLPVQAVTSFDPPPGNGDENGYAANLVVDGDPSTVWTTKEYLDPFGPSGIKTGVGLVLDLGSPQQIGSVTVRTVGATDFEVRTADDQGAALDDYTPVDKPVLDAVGRAVVVPPKELRARYVLIWLTSLPADNGRYRGQIAEVIVRD